MLDDTAVACKKTPLHRDLSPSFPARLMSSMLILWSAALKFQRLATFVLAFRNSFLEFFGPDGMLLLPGATWLTLWTYRCASDDRAVCGGVGSSAQRGPHVGSSVRAWWYVLRQQFADLTPT